MFTIKNLSQASLVMTLAAAVFLPASVQAQTCAEPVAADFRVDTLINGGVLNTGEYVPNPYHQNATQAAGTVQIAVAPDGKVFIAKMQTGQVIVYNPALVGGTLAGTVPTKFNNEDGLLGIVLAPDFATSKWVYVFHADSASPQQYNYGLNTVNTSQQANFDQDVRMHTLTRYTYDANAASGSQLINPKTILRFNRILDTRAYHAAGGLDITSDGVMVIGTGDDTSPHSGECSNNNSAPILWNNRGCDAQKSSSNTNDLRGKILRITPIAFSDGQTPTPGIGATYNIPAGNLWEKINDPVFNPNWNAANDTVAKVRKEIYSMGHRNPYHPRIDKKSGWVFAGEVGLDASSPSSYTPTRGPEGREEWNLVTAPGFFGHPYCNGPNNPWRKFTWPATTWNADSMYNCAAVQNVSPNNTGIRNLPPAKPAVIWYSNDNATTDDGARLGITGSTNSETAVGGPMYRYSPSMSSAGGKFPPYFEGKVFFFDWANTSRAFSVIIPNPDGTIPAGAAGVKTFVGKDLVPSASYIDMRFGPSDGAMYLLKYSGGGYSANGNALFRMRYVGTYNDSCYREFTATVGPGAVSIDGGRPAIRKTLSPNIIVNGLVTLPVGYRSVALYNLSGRKVWSYNRATTNHSEVVKVPMELAKGLLQAKLVP